MDKTESELKKELGQLRMRQALDRIEEAQHMFEAGLSDLSVILGGSKSWSRGGKLYERIKAFWHELEELNYQLARKGGPWADECTVQAELKRHATGKKEPQNDAPPH